MGRYAYEHGRTLAQLIRFCEVFSRRQGSYLWAEMQQDPEIIEAIAAQLSGDDRPTPPPLFGWTPIIDWFTRVGNQLIANRPNSDPSKAKFYPSAVIPALTYRRKTELSALESDILESQSRYAERMQAINN